VEIKLHSAKLPGPANGIHQFDVDFGTVKCGLAGNDFVRNVAALQGVFKGANGQLPVFISAEKILAVVGVPNAELHLIYGKAEALEYGQGKIHAANDFVLDLLRSTEDMGIVLGKAAHAQQAVHHARALVAIHGAQFAQADREVAVGAQAVAIDEDVPGAVHGLDAIVGVIELHGGKHVLCVVAFVSAGLPEIHAKDMGSVDQRVSALEVLFAHPVFHLFADKAALGMPEDQTRPGQLLNAEQVKLL